MTTSAVFSALLMTGVTNAAILADFTGSTTTSEAVGNVTTPANLNAGTTGATWSDISSTDGAVTVANTRTNLTGNYLFIGRVGNSATHTSTAKITFDSAMTLSGSSFSLDAVMADSGGQGGMGLIIQFMNAGNLVASVHFGSDSSANRQNIAELDASGTPGSNLFSDNVWKNGSKASVTFNFGATDYTVGVNSELPLGSETSASLNYINAATQFDTIIFTADKNKASWALDNISVVPEPSSTTLLGLAGLALILRRRR